MCARQLPGRPRPRVSEAKSPTQGRIRAGQGVPFMWARGAQMVHRCAFWADGPSLRLLDRLASRESVRIRTLAIALSGRRYWPIPAAGARPTALEDSWTIALRMAYEPKAGRSQSYRRETASGVIGRRLPQELTPSSR